MDKVPSYYLPQPQPSAPVAYFPSIRYQVPQPRLPPQPPAANYPPPAYYAQQPQPPPAFYLSPQQNAATFQRPAIGPPGRWTTGLCSCFADFHNFFITHWCPCITFGKIAEIVDRGSPSAGTSAAIYGLICGLTGCQCVYSSWYRAKLRSQYNLPAEPCNDFCVQCCCEYCSLCQMYRELKNRGFDMKLGWHGSVQSVATAAAATATTTMPPQVAGGMVR